MRGLEEARDKRDVQAAVGAWLIERGFQPVLRGDHPVAWRRPELDDVDIVVANRIWESDSRLEVHGYWADKDVPLVSGNDGRTPDEIRQILLERQVYRRKGGKGYGKEMTWREHQGRRMTPPSLVSVASTTWTSRLAERLTTYRSRVEAVVAARCPHCRGKMCERLMSKGPHSGEHYLGCRDWPECRGRRAPWTEGLPDDNGTVVPGIECPDCDSAMVLRYATRGPNKGKPFYGCSGFPECRSTLTEEEALARQLMGPRDSPRINY